MQALCKQEWRDIFLTAPDYNETDDEFVCPMHSVRLVKSGDKIGATVVEEECDCLMPAYPALMNAEQNTAVMGLQVGDMIRVGQATHGSFSDYVTILELIDIDELANTFQIALDVGAAPTIASGAKVLKDQTPLKEYPANRRALRISTALECTSLPHKWPTFTTALTTRQAADLDTRTQAIAYTKDTTSMQKYFWPVYKQRKWTHANQPTRSVLRLQMPTSIRQVSSIKLMGYSMVHKRAVGILQQHEMHSDDWFALRLKEVSGDVLSNNSHANGCLYVLHTGNGTNKVNGSVELYGYDPQGLATASFTPTNLPSITVDITDRLGNEAHFGRMHLWLRVLVNVA